MKKTILLIMTICIFIITGCYNVEDPFPPEEPTATPPPGSVSFWAKIYGGTGADVSNAIQETSDNGFMVFGYSSSFGDGSQDFLVLKLDNEGDIDWGKTYGGTGTEYAYTGLETSDGGFIIAGRSTSFGATGYDAWILKRDNTGMITWQKRYGGTGIDYIYSMIEIADSKYVVAGYTESTSSSRDFWIMKIATNGDIEWQKAFGGNDIEGINSIQQTSDNGFIIAGYTCSFGAGSYDGWVIKLNSIGNIEWQKTLGSTGADTIRSIRQTSDNGFIIAGDFDPDDTEIHDYWVVRMNNSGEILWQYTYGGSNNDITKSIRETPDGGYIVSGQTLSFGQGLYDAWLVKLTEDGNIEWQKTYGGTNDDRIESIQVTSDGGLVAAGYTQSYGSGGWDIWVLKLNELGECTPLDCDTFVTPQVPSPSSSVPSNVVINASLGSSDTICTVNENPDVTVIPLVP